MLKIKTFLILYKKAILSLNMEERESLKIDLFIYPSMIRKFTGGLQIIVMKLPDTLKSRKFTFNFPIFNSFLKIKDLCIGCTTTQVMIKHKIPKLQDQFCFSFITKNRLALNYFVYLIYLFSTLDL